MRGYSLGKKATTVLYGNGEAKTRRSRPPRRGIATVGENLIVFDYGPGEEGTHRPSATA